VSTTAHHFSQPQGGTFTQNPAAHPPNAPMPKRVSKTAAPPAAARPAAPPAQQESIGSDFSFGREDRKQSLFDRKLDHEAIAAAEVERKARQAEMQTNFSDSDSDGLN
jgi:hypothetical protein